MERIGNRAAGEPKTNAGDLVMLTVSGQIAHPLGKSSPYRIGYDGIPRVLPGTGGVVVNYRVGDRCVGLAGDHIESGVSLRNNKTEIVGKKNGPNLALLTYSCVGNVAKVITGPCKGKLGTVTGKHGGVENLLVDFPSSVLRRLRIGDQIQVYSYGLGLRFTDHPQIKIFSCSPRLIRRWGLRTQTAHVQAPVTHCIPASIMGSGIGKSNAVRGDYDIQLFDPDIRRKYKLETLRFGDFVAIIHSDTRFGRSYRGGAITIGIIVHSDSTVSGHGPGVLTLLTATRRHIEPLKDPNANLSIVLGLRKLPAAKAYCPLIQTKRIPGKGTMMRKPCLPVRLTTKTRHRFPVT
ncbi:MAG: DUF4438 domain-containing protein [Candidatus Brocadiaceae bacterium]|nr:DUF4438 domain-containing protein [Candidatus Brocadiaceae bacterium]